MFILNKEVIELHCIQVRESFYKQFSSVGYQFPEYKAISFRQQVVAGMNYIIKVSTPHTQFNYNGKILTGHSGLFISTSMHA